MFAVRQEEQGVDLNPSEDDSLETGSTTASFDALREGFHDLRSDIERGFNDLERGFDEMRSRLHASAAGQKRLIDSYMGDEGR